jgi:hypothetical protein
LQARSVELQARNSELQARGVELETRSVELEARNAELQTRDADLQARHVELDARHQELSARYRELEEKFGASELAGHRARDAAATADRRFVEIEQRDRVQTAALESVRNAFEDAVARLKAERSRTEPVEAPARPDDRHELFVPTAAGYFLLERPGPAPASGTEIELPSGERFSVMRVGPSPMPGEAHACAYLDRIDTVAADSLTEAL